MKSGILEKNILTKEALFLRLRLATIELVQTKIQQTKIAVKNLALSSNQNQCMEVGSRYINAAMTLNLPLFYFV